MTNTRNMDAEFCGKVPLHQTNLIQPHGVLLVVQTGDLAILQASENAAEIFGCSITDLVKSNLSTYISEAETKQLISLFSGEVSGKLPLSVVINGRSFLCMVEQQEQHYVLEIWVESAATSGKASFVSIFQDIKLAMAAIEACVTTEETCHVVARELKRLSGFDKVMVYRFDADWNGDVVAEEKEEGMESYLGLKFPASDIPRQARELYKKSPYRLIPTTDYEPVRLYPVINPLTNAFTDLSNSNLRSVAAVHIEYLRNMKVNASMSTRILKDGELWGLVACHHRTPKYLSYEMCSVFELLSGAITTKISAVQSRDSFAYKADRQPLQTKIMQEVLATGRFNGEKGTLLQLLDADGAAIVSNRRIETAGRTPGRQEIEDLVYWLQAIGVSGVYHQPALPSVYDAAEAYYQTASGLLALPIEMDKGDCVLLFRTEAVQKIAWGGNPEEAVQFESNGKDYHPRASFQIWQQTVKQTAIPWKNETLEIAESLRNFLIESRLSKKYFG